MSPCVLSETPHESIDMSAVPANETGALHVTVPSVCSRATAATFAVVPHPATLCAASAVTFADAATEPRSVELDQSEGSLPPHDGP